MASDTKYDSDIILAKVDTLAKNYRSDSRSWWPKFVFHYTAIENVPSILQSGYLYSRDEVLRRQLLQVDGASSSVLAKSSETTRSYVRLYFRPKTPTQYRNEGIRPKNEISLGSHCPIPVMLLFDSKDILTRSVTKFSDGSLAGYNPGKIGSRASFFKRLPFRDIYHNRSLQRENKRVVIARRHAEVIVPNSLDLDALRYIWCRSNAEKETLLSLLDDPGRKKWEAKIFHGQKYDLFFSKWSYVHRVDLESSRIYFQFNKNTTTPSPFKLSAWLYDHDSGDKLQASEVDFSADNRVQLIIKNAVSNYTIEFFMDDNLAYRNRYHATDDVF